MDTLPPLIVERAEDFHGRRWVFQELDDWLQRDPAERYFLITGEPGSGKTAIAARILQFSSGLTPPDGYARLRPSCLGAAHFCSARDATSIDPRNFASSIALQLSTQSQDYARALQNAGDKVVNLAVQITATSVSNLTAIHIVMRRSRCPRRSHDNLRLVFQILGGHGALKLTAAEAGWDRILACIGKGGIPAAGGSKKAGFGAPGKSSRAIFAFCSPRPPLGSLTKEMG
jgi:hypothetical protein